MLYYWVKQVHVWSVALSFTLFLLRGAWVLAGHQLPHGLVLRSLPHVIDTVLLTSALWLTTIIQQYPFQQSWLTTKVLLLLLYIVLGNVALRRARSQAGRVLAFTAACGVFLFIYSVARLHHPLGALLLVPG
ncbi:SirB2 family protein [Thioalkalivibrio sp. XN279]|uniref:SirB2 family protein n=1 Tax=Thioalkalivibrio sp. XN279 TaxID=2714953 RepID=UPI0014087786|nr:SirB2 family protein [Thioalkalivibrio sp. XN279]